MAFLHGGTVSYQGRRPSRAACHQRARLLIAMSVTKAEVMEFITSSETGQRLAGVNKARELEPLDCLNLLSLAAADPDLNVRYASVSQLAQAGKADPAKTLELLRDLVKKESDPSIVAALSDCFCALGIQEAYADLEAIFESNNDTMVQFSVLAGLGELGNPKAFDLLASVLKSDEGEVLLKIGALGAIGELGDARAIEVVKPYIESADPTLKERAQLAMTLLQQS